VKPRLVVLIAFLVFCPAIAGENPNLDHEIILPVSPPQKVFQRYQTNFSFHHDRGFYFSAALGPQWTQSLEKPVAKGIRFGGKINAGWFVADGFSLLGSVWGNFLEVASLIAGGPGISVLFDSTNIGVDFSFGIGRVFNAVKRDDIKDFSESVLAANLSIGKFWWLSDKTSMGVSLLSGVHGMTLSEGKLGSFGWNTGLALAFLFG
jgi:hypothetical protein